MDEVGYKNGYRGYRMKNKEYRVSTGVLELREDVNGSLDVKLINTNMVWIDKELVVGLVYYWNWRDRELC